MSPAVKGGRFVQRAVFGRVVSGVSCRRTGGGDGLVAKGRFAAGFKENGFNGMRQAGDENGSCASSPSSAVGIGDGSRYGQDVSFQRGWGFKVVETWDERRRRWDDRARQVAAS